MDFHIARHRAMDGSGLGEVLSRRYENASLAGFRKMDLPRSLQGRRSAAMERLAARDFHVKNGAQCKFTRLTIRRSRHRLRVREK